MTLRKLIDLAIIAAVGIHLAFIFIIGGTHTLPFQIMVPLAYIAATFWFVHSWRQRSDEVQVSDAKNSLATGVGIGLAMAFLAAAALTTFPGLAALLANNAWIVDSPHPPAVVGFTVGVLACIILVTLAYEGAALFWWLNRRSN